MSTGYRPFSDVMDDVVENVDGVGSATADATMRRFTLQEFRINCKWACAGDDEAIDLLCTIDGVGPTTAQSMANYVHHHADLRVVSDQ